MQRGKNVLPYAIHNYLIQSIFKSEIGLVFFTQNIVDQTENEVQTLTVIC